jgi:four helix bundle protein
MGSLFELETQLVIIQELGLIDSKDLKIILELAHKEGRMINGLINKIKKS